MTDRELLESAAKAAGRVWLSYHHTKGLCCRDDSFGGLIEYYWNPLTDDGDALRLAVKLGICFGPNLDGDMAVAFGSDGRNITEEHGGDSYAATRRAIVRAAAEIGKAME